MLIIQIPDLCCPSNLGYVHGLLRSHFVRWHEDESTKYCKVTIINYCILAPKSWYNYQNTLYPNYLINKPMNPSRLTRT